MLTYLVLKTIHTLAAGAAISGFILRGYWMISESPMLQRRGTRIIPHLVDQVTAQLDGGVTLSKAFRSESVRS